MSTFTIRRATPQDASAMARNMSHPEVFGGLLQLPFTDEAIWRQRLESHVQDRYGEIHLVAEEDGHLLGSAGLFSTEALCTVSHTLKVLKRRIKAKVAAMPKNMDANRALSWDEPRLRARNKIHQVPETNTTPQVMRAMAIASCGACPVPFKAAHHVATQTKAHATAADHVARA